MSHERSFHSLPKKAQPGQSNYKMQTTTAARSSVRQTECCPEISEFKPSKYNEELYIHRLQIDYGRLERPHHFYFDGPHKYQQVVKMTDLSNDFAINEQMSTRRMTGISSLANQCSLQERETEKKDTRVEYLNQKTEEARPTSSCKNLKRVKIKLTEVKAYEQLTKREPSVKRLHSRIVKMMVGGGKVTTKVISYPNNEQYLKLCGLR